MAWALGTYELWDFWAPWCKPCLQLHPILEQWEQRGVPIRRVNVEDHPDIAQQWHVMSLPTLLVMVNGREVHRWVGYLPAGALQQKLDIQLDSSSVPLA